MLYSGKRKVSARRHQKKKTKRRRKGSKEETNSNDNTSQDEKEEEEEDESQNTESETHSVSDQQDDIVHSHPKSIQTETHTTDFEFHSEEERTEPESAPLESESSIVSIPDHRHETEDDEIKDGNEEEGNNLLIKQVNPDSVESTQEVDTNACVSVCLNYRQYGGQSLMFSSLVPPPIEPRSNKLTKYWSQRYRLFSLYDDGICMDHGESITITRQYYKQYHVIVV